MALNHKWNQPDWVDLSPRECVRCGVKEFWKTRNLAASQSTHITYWYMHPGSLKTLDNPPPCWTEE